MINKKIKLLVVVSGLGNAGAELMLFRMLKHLDRNCFCINVISLKSKDQVGVLMEAHGIRVHALHINGLASLAIRFLQLIQLIREIRPDVVQTWMYHADLLGGLAARITGVRNIVWSIRNSSLSLETTKLSTYVVAKICSGLSSWLPKVIINCSESARASHVSFGYSPKPMVVVPNGFELDQFAPIANAHITIRRELGLSSESRIVGLIGRYHPVKNHNCFIRAAVKISSINPSVNFLLCGEGVDTSNSELLQMIRPTTLLNRFYLLGQRSDMPSIMSSLDVLVSASLGEAFPNVIGEAMACGIPCVATDVGETAYIIGDAGKVVPAGDSEKLANSVLELLSLNHNERTWLSQKARNRIVNNFDIKQISLDYHKLYAQLQ